MCGICIDPSKVDDYISVLDDNFLQIKADAYSNIAYR